MTHLLFVLALAVQQPTSPSAPADDPFVWLEDVESAHSMEWVNAKNAATLAVLGQGPLYQTLYDRFKQILDSKDKIAYPGILGNSLYNFWQDADHERGIWRRTTWAGYASALLVGTDFGPGGMTTSGYARIIKLWKRGTPLSTATTVYEAPANHVSASASSTNDGARRYLMIRDGTDFYHRTRYLYDRGQVVKLGVPTDADVSIVHGQLVVYVRDPWTASGKTWPTASLIAMPLDDFLGGRRAFQLVMQPGPRETINGVTSTRDYLLLNVLNNVRGELRRYRYQDGRWTFEKVPAPDLGTVGVVARSATSNRYFFTFTNFIQPAMLYVTAADGGVAKVRRLRALFGAAGLFVAL